MKNLVHFIFTEKNFVIDIDEEIADKKIMEQVAHFGNNKWQALYDLSFEKKPEWVDVAGGYLYQLAGVFQQCLTRNPDIELLRENTELFDIEESCERLLCSVPFSLGSEYVTEDWIKNSFENLLSVFSQEIKAFDGSVALYLSGKSQQLKVPERIFFHIVENKEDSDFPFAFIATYATKNKRGRLKHMPLQYALTEYKAERSKLLELLSCLNQAAEVSPLIKEFVENGEMFHPLRLKSDEAYRLLCDVPRIEESGIICRIPNWWRRGNNKFALSVNIGEERPAMVGLDAILQMVPQLTVDGVPLTKEEIEMLLEQTEGLALLKGRWVSVNHEQLKQLLEQMEKYKGELTLMDALRMGLNGDGEDGQNKEGIDIGPVVTNGEWLSELLADMRKPKKIRSAVVPKSFNATLRPYQKTGYTWLNYMNELHFGACLADDMGLGKTVQVLAFLEKMRKSNPKARVLLIVPTSLLGNWQREARKFAPEISVTMLHGGGAKVLGELVTVDDSFLTVTTYGMAKNIPELEDIVWDCLILDEAQAIKNPSTKQTRQIKKLKGNMKIAMTGTPIENDLSNLWSLFDFLNKGLLGSSQEFRDFCKTLDQRPQGYARLKAMISPFMLRRIKTDKTIISDLPEKLEQNEYVELSKKQTVLYRKYVARLAERLNEAEGMERRGMVLASLSKLKQICNHPDQYMGQDAYDPKESGKFQMLREICETIYEKHERVLIFTQFKEIIPYLDDFLCEVFHGRRGFVLHGGTSAANRNKMVEEFQSEKYIPYMILSVKAGGTGLTLTNANHVIHFDRWWNPAVENQATDRAYRIGQTQKVMVHKLISRGTIEEKIDAMIESKKELAENVVGSGGESWITEMSNEQLLSIFTLDEE